MILFIWRNLNALGVICDLSWVIAHKSVTILAIFVVLVTFKRHLTKKSMKIMKYQQNLGNRHSVGPWGWCQSDPMFVPPIRHASGKVSGCYRQVGARK